MESQEQVQPEETTTAVVTKTKTKDKSNVLFAVAEEVEGLTKPKALNLAEKLSDTIETDYLRLGGVLKVIYENAWFEGYETFGSFVAEKFGFQERKAKYLMEIYTSLIDKMIPWEKVSKLGWTKLKDLARFLTPENVDEWVEKAMPLTVVELQQLLKQENASKEKSVSTTDDVTTVKFKLKNDQAETIQQALNKAKAEGGTDYDNVALELICTGYLSGSVGGPSLSELMKQVGYEAVLEQFDSLFPNIDITVSVNG